MSTKNLARTVIEGGRHRRNQTDQRISNRRVRRSEREYTRRLRFDVDAAEGSLAPARQHVARAHDDRLAAVERWLTSFIGEPWDEVRAQMAQRFDVRTIAGQHIVYDHLLSSVRGSGHEGLGRQDFEVDDDGILRSVPRR